MQNLSILLGFCAAITACAPAAPPARPPLASEHRPAEIARDASPPPPAKAGEPAPQASRAQNGQPPPELPGKAPAQPFHELVQSLSERDRYYFSHNYVSNETSQLQVAPLLLERAGSGGAYLGVGPEQNFSYIAL